MSVFASRSVEKNYLVDKKPYYKHFQSRDITITAVRSIAIQGLMVFNGFVASLDLDEDEDETASEDEDEDELEKLKKKVEKKEKKEEFVPPSANDFGLACLTSFVKSLSITTCIRTLEEVAILYLRPQIVGKLVKDLGKAASRKYARTHSRFTAAALMFKTGMRGNVLGHISIFLVEEAHQVILILYRRYKKTDGKKHLRSADGKKKGEEDKEEAPPKTFLELTAKNATRSSLAVITGGLGAAVGTFVRPGLGTVIGATLGDTIAYMI